VSAGEAYTGRAAALRAAFDEAFAAPEAVRGDRGLDLLEVQVAGRPHALRVAELAGLFADRRIVRLPSPLPEFLGLTGLRGVVVPVYCLAALLGHPPAETPPRWLALGAAGPPLGLAFDALVGYHRVPRDAVVSASDPAGPYAGEAVRLADAVAPLLGLRSITEALALRLTAPSPSLEK
jgi:purine-binding chemotaxis protein CheW